MRVITDGKGRTWELAITIGGVKRVRALLAADMLEMIDGRDKGRQKAAIEKFTGDLVVAVDVIYVLLKPQADALGVTDEDFAESMFGEPMEKAIDTYAEEIIDFFRNPVLRAILQAGTARYRTVAGESEAAARKIVERISAGELDEILGLRVPGKSCGSAPGSPELPAEPSTSSPGVS